MSASATEDKIEDLEFKWGKKRGVGGKKKDVQFYESFTYDGVEYFLHDCVYMHKEGEPEPYIGKLIKIWENLDKSKKVKIQWFFRPSEILNWLGEDKAQENEIFLGSGEGVGLANVNPLEAISGKCNVVCISKDSRNPQPSAEELQMADYIFHRTFDVGHCVVVDKIDEKVGGLEVKFIFNRKQSDVVTAASKLHCENKKAIACNENAQLSGRSPAAQLNPVNSHWNINCLGAKGDGSVKDLVVKQESLAGRTLGSGARVDCDGRTTGNAEQGLVSTNKTVRCEVENGNNEIIVSKVLVNGVEVKEDEIPANDSGACDDSPLNIQKSSVPGNDVKALATSSRSKEKGETGLVKDSLLLGKGAKSTKFSNALEDRPPKKARVDHSVKLLEDKNRKNVEKLSVNAVDDTNHSTIVTSQGKSIPKYAKDSLIPDKVTLKEEKLDKNTSELSNKKLPKVSVGAPTSEIRRNESQEFEVRRRPNADKSKWFRELPWEGRMQSAHKEGKLVILRNLDPNYTSGEVEDIVWSAFKEYCTARMVQHTAISSPNSGQAFVIFKTRDAADKVIRKLDDGCLILSNGRPLVACSAPSISFPEKQSTYVGHLFVGKIKLQMHREMKEAVSTSHYSQPNSIEYEMAMEWCLLQSKSDRWWKQLYKQQGQEVRKLAANMKSK